MVYNLLSLPLGASINQGYDKKDKLTQGSIPMLFRKNLEYIKIGLPAAILTFI